jgi:hypothetical protein
VGSRTKPNIIIAKELLNDQKIVIVHYEEICISVGLAR